MSLQTYLKGIKRQVIDRKCLALFFQLKIKFIWYHLFTVYCYNANYFKSEFDKCWASRGHLPEALCHKFPGEIGGYEQKMPALWVLERVVQENCTQSLASRIYTAFNFVKEQ